MLPPSAIAVLFDWDGVVVDSSAFHEASWELLSEEIGLPLPEGHFKQHFGKKNQAIIPALGWSDDPEEVESLSLRKEEIYRELVRREGTEPLPGVRELLAGLEAAGIRRGIGSSTHRENIELILELIDLRGAFEVIISGEDVHHGKPDPEVFLLGAQKLGIDPARCVVIEDAFVGLEAARRAGMRSIAVATTNPLESLIEAADLAVERLTEIDATAIALLVARGN